MSQEKKEVKAIECRFSWHIAEKKEINPDLHLVKEIIHYTDGTSKPNLRWINDFKRSIWVTKPSARKHKDKKEWETLENLIERKVTQSQLRDTAAKMLDKGWSKDHLKKLSNSPYLYGTDISSTALVKKAYMVKYPDVNTPFTIATYDVESDVIVGHEEVIMASVVFQNKIFISVTKDFVNGLALVHEQFLEKVQKYIGEYVQKLNLEIELYIANDVIDVIRSGFNKIHEWKPDFLAIWNMDYDIPKILGMLKKYNIDPEDILCDPSIPKELRFCEYKQGTKKKTTAAGKVIPVNPAAQWHTLKVSASFYVIDAMCAYKHIRLGEQEEASYSLDAILNKRLGIRKLKFAEADQYVKLKWHQFMQSNYKIEYMVYNVFDSLSMIELDSNTKDLAFTLPAFSATSDFWNFKSQPKRISDALHYYALENGYVMGTVGESPREEVKVITPEDEIPEEESQVLSRIGWVVTLPAHMSSLGLPLIKEDKRIRTNIRGFVYDSDAVSAYPSATSVANVSRTTTRKEIISIENIDEDIFRMQNLNLIIGKTNSLEYCTAMFNFPKPEELLQKILGE